MSESGDIMRDIMERHGYNYADLGRILGVDRSTPRQVATGRKPGTNLRDALTELRQQLDAGRPPAITPPPKRTTKAGTPARVRRSATVSHKTTAGTEWSTTEARKQASRSGGTGIGRQATDAANKGRSMAITASFVHSLDVSVRSYGATRGIAPGRGGAFDMPLDAAAWLAAQSRGESFSRFVVETAISEGMLSGDGSHADLVEHGMAALDSLELRTW